MDDEDFYQSDEEVSSLEYFSLLVSWASVASSYVEMTMKLSSMMIEHFSTPSAFRFNAKKIKRIIFEGLSIEKKQIVADGDLIIARVSASTRSEKQRESLNERKKVLAHVRYLFVKLGVETYGDAFKSPLSPQSTKSHQSNPVTPQDVDNLSSLSSSTLPMAPQLTKSHQKSNLTPQEVDVSSIDEVLSEDEPLEDARQIPRNKYINSKGFRATPQGIFYLSIHII